MGPTLPARCQPGKISAGRTPLPALFSSWEGGAPSDPSTFRAGLELRATIRREVDDTHHARIRELVNRTTQLNTTGEPVATLAPYTVYSLSVNDRFCDYGLVGAVLVDGATIHRLVLSCRVLGLGLEDALLAHVCRDLAARTRTERIAARAIPTARNTPARDLFARAGFTATTDGWTISSTAIAIPPLPYRIAL